LGWDNLVPEFNFSLNLKRSLFSAWQEYQGLGLAGGMAHGASLSRELILWILSPLVPLHFTRYFWVFLMLIIGPVGVWFLTDFIFNKEKDKKQVSSLVAGSFYLFNLATLQYFYTPFETFSSFYGFIPWLIFFSLRFLSNSGRKNSLYLLIVSFLATSAFQVQTLFIVYLLIMSVFLVEYLVGPKQERKGVFKWILITLVTNLFWLVPVIYFTIFHGSINVDAKQNQLITSEVILMNKNYGDLSDILSLRGYWFDFLDKDESGKLVYILESWRNYFSDTSLLWIARGLTVVGLFGLFLNSFINRKKRFSVSLFVLPLLILVFLTAGKEPLGFIYNFLQNNIPLFSQIFRTTFTKWSMVFVLFISIGIGFFVDFIYQKIHKLLKPVLVSLAFLLIVLPVLPFFQGKLIYKRMSVNLPAEYLNLFSFFEQQPKQSRIALLPVEAVWGWEINDWGHRGSGFLWYGIEQPVLHRSFDVFSSFNETFYHQIKDALRRDDSEKVKQILNIYDVDYLVFDKSVTSISQKELEEEYELLISEIGFKEVFNEGNIIVWSSEDVGDSFISSPNSFERIKTQDSFQTRITLNELEEFIQPIEHEDLFIEFPFSDISAEDPKSIEIYENFISVFSEIDQGESQEFFVPAWKEGDKIIAFTKLGLKDGVITVKFAPPARFRTGEEFILASLGSYQIEYDPGREIERVVLEVNGQNLVLENNQEIEYPFFDLIVGDPINISVNEVIGGDEERGFFLKNGGGIDLKIEETVWKDWLVDQKFEAIGDSKIIVDIPSFSLNIFDYLADLSLSDQKNCDVFNRGTVSKTFSDKKITYQTENFGTFCESLGLIDIDVTYDYLISVSGNSYSGRPPKFLINSSIDNFIYLENPLPRGEFRKNYLSLSQKQRKENYFINFEFKSFGEGITKADISDLSLTYFSLPIDILSNIYSKPAGYLSSKSNIEINNLKKIGTSFYTLDAEVSSGDGLLTLSQGFDKGWIAMDGKFRIFPHVKYRNWANAWLISEGNYHLYIIYIPQIFVFISLFLLLSLLSIFYLKTGKKIKKSYEDLEELAE